MKIARIAFAAFALLALTSPAGAQQLGNIFTIDMENHNFTQPGGQIAPQALRNNPAAPFLNSLITPGHSHAAQTAWASRYHGLGADIHPSLPNYLWQEGGSNFGVFNDNEPYETNGESGTGGTNLSAPNLCGLLQNAGISWKSYQEDTQLVTDSVTGNLTSAVKPRSQWTVPLNGVSGTSPQYTNPYNGSHQYEFETKHDGTLYFTATNGGYDTSPSNPEASHYAPLPQLASDLTSNNTARYNIITPDLFNDAHTALDTDFTYNGVRYAAGTDEEAIAQGDNFLSQVVPQIQASQAYQNNGAIVIWWDETEDGDTSDYTLYETVISKLAKGNAYQSVLNYTHSSDLKTWQEVYGVYGPTSPFLGDANNPATNDLSDLFKVGVVPTPEPSPTIAFAVGVFGLASLTLRARRART